jgi:hypothetical protein
VPKHPETKAHLAEVEKNEASFEVKALVRVGVGNATEEEFSFP